MFKIHFKTIPHQTYASIATTPRRRTILIQFNLFYVFIMYGLYKYWYTPLRMTYKRSKHVGVIVI